MRGRVLLEVAVMWKADDDAVEECENEDEKNDEEKKIEVRGLEQRRRAIFPRLAPFSLFENLIVWIRSVDKAYYVLLVESVSVSPLLFPSDKVFTIQHATKLNYPARTGNRIYGCVRAVIRAI